MKYTEILQNIKEPIFSLQDLAMLGQKVIPSQISEMAKKGDLIRLKNGIYAISSRQNEISMEHVAFRLYSPSYVSLEWAMHKHGLMPDVPFNVTSVSPKPTRAFKNGKGTFFYRSIKRDYFFGYEKKEDRAGQPYLLAEPEKALLDYFYFNLPSLKTKGDIEGLRLNPFTLKELDVKKIGSYSKMFNNKSLDYLVLCLLQIK